MEYPSQRTFPGLGINHTPSLGACGQCIDGDTSLPERSECMLDLCEDVLQECKFDNGHSLVSEDCGNTVALQCCSTIYNLGKNSKCLFILKEVVL